MTLYEILGVRPDADKETIKKAYRRKAKEFHTDRSRDPATAAKFHEATVAYKLLTDDVKRLKYDQTGTAEDQFVDPLTELVKSAAELMTEVIAGCVVKGEDPKRVNILGRMKRTMFDRMEKAKKNVAMLRKSADGFASICGLFTVKGQGQNWLDEAADKQAVAAELQAKDAEMELDKMQRVMDFLDKYDFHPEGVPLEVPWMGQVQKFTWGGGP